MYGAERFMVGPFANGQQVIADSVNRIGFIIVPASGIRVATTPLGVAPPFVGAGFFVDSTVGNLSNFFTWERFGVLVRCAWYLWDGFAAGGLAIWEIFGSVDELYGGEEVAMSIQLPANRVLNVRPKNKPVSRGCECGTLRDAISRLKSFADRLDSVRAADKQNHDFFPPGRYS